LLDVNVLPKERKKSQISDFNQIVSNHGKLLIFLIESPTEIEENIS
jgi:hypothetical protein